MSNLMARITELSGDFWTSCCELHTYTIEIDTILPIQTYVHVHAC
jgi:hypothetical protein